MAYFEDLTPYAYSIRPNVDPSTLNVGWLAAGHDFPVAEPTEQLLGLLWAYCRVSFAQTRGWHDCEFCNVGTTWFQREGAGLLLGTSEIRVFGESDVSFAAPTMLYHYVEAHHYQPPAPFIRALLDEPAPPDPKFFSRVLSRGLEWGPTSAPTSEPGRFRFTPRGLERLVPEPDAD